MHRWRSGFATGATGATAAGQQVDTRRLTDNFYESLLHLMRRIPVKAPPLDFTLNT